MAIKIIGVDGVTRPAKNGFTFEDARKVVGGHVEVIRMGSEAMMLVNEDGGVLGLPVNGAASDIACVFHEDIVGDVVYITGKASIRSVMS